MSNTEAMDALRSEITVGWRVKIIDHDYLNDSRDDVTVEQVTDTGLILYPRRPWSSQGRSLSTMTFRWDGDLEVDGRTVHLFHTPPPHTGKPRRLIKTFVFTPPREY
jgi:hypothetical protein